MWLDSITSWLLGSELDRGRAAESVVAGEQPLDLAYQLDM